MTRALPLALAIALAGCTLPGKRADAPAAAAVVPPPSWRTQTPPGVPIAGAWWMSFGDAHLTALVERALANNLDIAVAAGRVEEARAAQALARAQLLPTIGGQVPETQGQTLSPFGTPSRAFGAQPAITASFDLDLFGRLKQASRAARAQLLASEGARDTVRLAVAASTASGYVTLRALDQRLEIARGTLAARSDALRIARRRFETGYSSRLELRQAQAEYAATAQLVPQAQLAISRQENALSLLTGDAPRSIARGLPLDRLLLPPIPDGLPADLLRRRPDVFQAEQTLVAADRSLDSQRAAMLPNLALTGSAGVVLSTALSNPVGVFSLGASILSPIFDGGRLRAQERGAVARRDQAAFAYRRTALTAFREVDDALAGYARIAQQAQDLSDQANAARGALENATNRYRAGYSAYIEQLDAQRSLLTAQLALTQTQADRLTNFVALYQAMGGGWSRAEIDATTR
ncbi:efflux transporter outer membrane subunit [Sphingomonas sp. RHCKR47]|uniref:efflux transporter outer membrane subunit n=1 Tax=Sphingomonas citricola TaxID=2862498 RepID=UPI001CA563B7|nr:efflux transporter outer membrane subunit [Sphingomonas citricola]MBW6522034.1 efflux transporter outer membrane subunit [Sphingomonas citricola]